MIGFDDSMDRAPHTPEDADFTAEVSIALLDAARLNGKSIIELLGAVKFAEYALVKFFYEGADEE